MKRLNVAIIGQGRSGRDIHGKYFKSEDNKYFNVVAIVDKLEHRRKRAVEEYGCEVFENVSDLYGREDIDLVVNSTYSQIHSSVAIDLLKHGFNVVSEKPFAKTYEDGCRMVKAAKENGVMLNIFQQSRFAPYYTKIKEIIASGKLGDIKQVSINFSKFARRWDWQTLQSFAGGEVRNTGPHPIDQALDLMNYPENVNVFSKLDLATTFGDAEDYAKIILSAPNAPLVDIEITTCNCYVPYLYLIQGSKGTLKGSVNHIDIKYYTPDAEPTREVLPASMEDENGYPMYCTETLSFTEESFDLEGDAFNVGTAFYYKMVYDYLTEGKEMEIKPEEQLLLQLKVIDLIHAQNPLPVKFE